MNKVKGLDVPGSKINFLRPDVECGEEVAFRGLNLERVRMATEVCSHILHCGLGRLSELRWVVDEAVELHDNGERDDDGPA